MRASSRRSGLSVAAASAVLLLFLASPLGAETDDAIARLLAGLATPAKSDRAKPGSDIPVKPAAAPQPDEERRILDELDMLERARAEAETHHRPADKPTDTDPSRRAAEARRAQDTAAEEAAAERRKADEKAARVEAARREAETKEREAAEARRIADQQRPQPDQREPIADRADDARSSTDEAELAQMEAEREAEATRIDDALRKAREAHARRQREAASGARGDTSPSGYVTADRRGAAPEARPEPASDALPLHAERRNYAPSATDLDAAASTTRVTVLMVMEPGDRGIRRHNKTADPLLCGEKGCYIGAGADVTAQLLPRYRAFGPGRTLGERAGACRNSLGCVFRGVDLVAYPAVLQPIDMRVLRHDRRQPQVLEHASRCRVRDGRLSCTAIRGPDYTMWVVPERLAEQVGAAELERVVAAGLGQADALASQD